MTPVFGRTPPRYHFLRDLARGGMGRVELCVREEGTFRRVYAVKRLRPEFRDDTHIREMFVEEARVAGLLNHPNVVGVLDVGSDDDGPFLVMPFIEGMNAAALVKWVRGQKKVLPVQLCARIIRDVAEGLHAAHELKSSEGEALRVVHRDVSPQNILLGYDGSVRLTDFGVAKALGRAHRTNTGVLKGKFGYMSPEQLQFEEPDRRSDLFSLGVVFFELLSGARLYASEDMAESARRILKEPPPDIDEVRSDVHPAIVEVLFQMLTRDRDHRPADARTVARRLDEVIVDLVATEGPVVLADFMEEHFADEQHAAHESLSQIKSVPLLSIVRGPDTVVDQKSSTAVRWIGALAALALLAGSGWYVTNQLRAPEAPAEPHVLEAPPDDVPPQAPSPLEAPSAEEDSVAEAELQDAADQEAPEVVRRPPQRPRARRDTRTAMMERDVRAAGYIDNFEP